jgi:hypothetical protein
VGTPFVEIDLNNKENWSSILSQIDEAHQATMGDNAHMANWVDEANSVHAGLLEGLSKAFTSGPMQFLPAIYKTIRSSALIAPLNAMIPQADPYINQIV